VTNEGRGPVKLCFTPLPPGHASSVAPAQQGAGQQRSKIVSPRTPTETLDADGTGGCRGLWRTSARSCCDSAVLRAPGVGVASQPGRAEAHTAVAGSQGPQDPCRGWCAAACPLRRRCAAEKAARRLHNPRPRRPGRERGCQAHSSRRLPVVRVAEPAARPAARCPSHTHLRLEKVAERWFRGAPHQTLCPGLSEESVLGWPYRSHSITMQECTC
jgi:hypothetical protein